MTPPPKPRKKAKLEELVIIDVSIRPPPTKPEQIVCSQSSRGHHAVLDLRASSIVKRALEKEKNK